MTAPAEVGAWDGDFSYGYLERLYEMLQIDFDLCLIGHPPGAISPNRPRAFIRHDIDVSLDRALELAQREAAWGVGATYHVMIDSPFYDVRSKSSTAAVQGIAKLGHEVGLHYDTVARGTHASHPAKRELDIADACGELEEVLERQVCSLSFHRPTADVIRGPLNIAGRISAYASELCRWYLSDSRGRWREGNPIEGLGKPPSADTLQILIHPIWWGECHQKPGARLRDFLIEAAPASGNSQGYEELRTALWDHILYRADDL